MGKKYFGGFDIMGKTYFGGFDIMGKKYTLEVSIISKPNSEEYQTDIVSILKVRRLFI